MSLHPPTVLFIFGGSGDLTYRKLMPALYNLYLDGYLPEQVKIYALGRSAYTTASYRTYARKGLVEHARRKERLRDTWKAFSARIEWVKADLLSEKTYKHLGALVKGCEKAWNTKANVVYYMSVAPKLVPGITEKLCSSGLVKDSERARMVFEKPFGHDLRSAQDLNILLGRMYKEEQIYRIDHYLGKETVQNIVALRFANALFEPIWNNRYIDHVQITAAETVNVEERGAYYDTAGALRDMVQNHILQLLCMVAMEAPVSFEADEIRNKKLDVLRAIRPFKAEEVHSHAVRGQYGEGELNGESVPAYRRDDGVAPDSRTETFAAVKFHIDNWRWKDVPFYVRTGKSMAQKSTVITVQFKPAPQFAFPDEAAESWRPNRLTISISPKMDIRLRFQAKKPGPHMALIPVDMVFSYEDSYGAETPEAYETLLEDVIEGNPTLFMRADQVEAAWKILQPILEAWEHTPPADFPNYSPGSWGPEAAQHLITGDGREWSVE